MRIAFLGMGGALSYLPLRAMVGAGMDIGAVLVPAAASAEVHSGGMRRLPAAPSPSQLPLVTAYVARDVMRLAWEQEIPVYEIEDLRLSGTARALRDLGPELVCVSCFTQRIPGALLALPRHGFLNLHPSLLPAYRGPHPLFWQFRHGVRESGVTLHFMDEGLDTGPIALQAPLTWPDGISGAKAERRAGEVGGRLFVEAVERLAQGTLPRRSQPGGGSRHPAPEAADFTLSTAWTARRAFNFICGTAQWGRRYPLAVAGESLHLRAALAYDLEQTLEKAYERDGNEVAIRFSPGVLRATLA